MQTPPQTKKVLPAYLPVTLILLLAGALLAAGCTSPPATGAGGPAAQGKTIMIGDILKNPGTYNGTAVSLQGKIVTECGSGCWFILDDGTGSLYVDLAPNNFAIPQISGTTVAVDGTIGMKNGDPILVATKVVAGSRSWP